MLPAVFSQSVAALSCVSQSKSCKEAFEIPETGISCSVCSAAWRMSCGCFLGLFRASMKSSESTEQPAQLQSALMKSPKGFKPIDSHQNWPQTPVELLSWLRCWLYICVCVVWGQVLFANSWDGTEAALFPKIYQRRRYWLIEVDFSPIHGQPGPFPRCDLCPLLKF